MQSSVSVVFFNNLGSPTHTLNTMLKAFAYASKKIFF